MSVYSILRYTMTLKAFILNTNNHISEKALFCDFIKYALLQNGIKDTETVTSDGADLKLNDNEADALLVLTADVQAERVDFASIFLCSKNVRLLSNTGEFIGAYIGKKGAFTSMQDITDVIKTDAAKITSKNFTEICDSRRIAVYNALSQNNVYIESGAVISPLAAIGENTFIGAGCRIEGNTVIGKNCSVISSVITDSVIGDNVSIGPFAYIRPGCKVGDNVKVGDFVELKNSVIGNDTKISHLTYVGDSDVGSKVNFGCGTITVNYDGHKKHRTVIGDNAFIGCNTNLIAPVTVGNNTFIAAGSTVTDDIPDDSFAIARQRQTTKTDYMKGR